MDEFDPNEEEEFDLWRLFRGINMRDTSSVFTEDRPPCPPSLELYHPKRPDCTLGGDATAVMEDISKTVEYEIKSLRFQIVTR